MHPFWVKFSQIRDSYWLARKTSECAWYLANNGLCYKMYKRRTPKLSLKFHMKYLWDKCVTIQRLPDTPSTLYSYNVCTTRTACDCDGCYFMEASSGTASALLRSGPDTEAPDCLRPCSALQRLLCPRLAQSFPDFLKDWSGRPIAGSGAQSLYLSLCGPAHPSPRWLSLQSVQTPAPCWHGMNCGAAPDRFRVQH